VKASRPWTAPGKRSRSEAKGPPSVQDFADPAAGERLIALDASVSRLLADRPAEAKAKAEDILKATPDHAHAQLVLGSAMRRLGDASGAAKVLGASSTPSRALQRATMNSASSFCSWASGLGRRLRCSPHLRESL
jgi:hypothetical protein